MIFVVGWSQIVAIRSSRLRARASSGCTPRCSAASRAGADPMVDPLRARTYRGDTVRDRRPDGGLGFDRRSGHADVAADETATTLFARIANAHVELTRELLPQLLAGTAPRIPQDPSRASSWPRRTPADGIIDWETGRDTSTTGCGRRRALSGRLHVPRGREGDRLERARRRSCRRGAGGHGRRGRAGRTVVACGEGALVLEEIQTSAGELEVGARLG